MATELLIDGYNLLHFAGLARARYAKGDLQRARDRLLKRIRNGLTDEERGRTTIVFDARDADHVERRESRPFGMLVLFSPVGREADDTIEELVDAHSSPRQLIVVSSDNRLKRAARSVRAGWMDSDSFLLDLDRRTELLARPVTNDDAALPARTTSRSASVDDDFLNIDVAAIERELRGEVETVREDVPQKAAAKPVATPPPSAPAKTQSSPEQQPLPDRVQFDWDDPSGVPAEELDFWQKRVNELLGE